MIDECQLYVELEKVKAILQKSEWKYYHVKSVENFIYHLKSFKNERTRERMANEIGNYVKLVSEKLHEPSEVHDKRKELFPSIWKLFDVISMKLVLFKAPNTW